MACLARRSSRHTGDSVGLHVAGRRFLLFTSRGPRAGGIQCRPHCPQNDALLLDMKGLGMGNARAEHELAPKRNRERERERDRQTNRERDGQTIVTNRFQFVPSNDLQIRERQ